jgi:hypothetical protein
MGGVGSFAGGVLCGDLFLLEEAGLAGVTMGGDLLVELEEAAAGVIISSGSLACASSGSCVAFAFRLFRSAVKTSNVTVGWP